MVFNKLLYAVFQNKFTVIRLQVVTFLSFLRTVPLGVLRLPPLL